MFPPEKRTCSLKRNYLSRKCIFQALIFRATFVSFPGSFPWESQCPSVRAHLCITSSQWISRYSWSFRRARTSCWSIRSRIKGSKRCQDTKTVWILILKDHMESISYHYTNYMKYVCKNQKNIIYMWHIDYTIWHTGHYMIYIYVIKYHLNSFKYENLILILRPVPPINTTTGQPGFFPPPFQYIPSWSKPAA